MQEQRQTIYTSHEERGGLRPHGGLSGAWRGDQVSIAKSRRRNCLRRLSVSKNLSCHSEDHPKGTCFAARSDVGIRNLLAANSQKSVKIVRFGNRLPRQSADRLAMTGFFDSLKRTALRRFFSGCRKSLSMGSEVLLRRGSSRGQSPPRIRSNVAQSLALQGVRGAKRLFSCRKAAQK